MYFDQFSQEKSPIIICGCPRSGTTALVDLFNKNGYLITNEWATLALRSSGLSTEEYFLEKQKVINNSELSDWLQKITNKQLILEPNWQTLDYPELAYKVYGSLDVWGDKWRYELIIDSVLEDFPYAKIIYIHRDARDIVSSLIKNKMVSSLTEAFNIWTESILSWKNWKNRIKHVAISQIDLALNPSHVALELENFLGISFENYSIFDPTLETYKEFTHRILSHHDYYNIADDQSIPELVNKLLKELDYVE